MSRTVEYVGFDAHPNLRLLAEQAVSGLWSLIADDGYDEAEIKCLARPDVPGIELSVTFHLPTGDGTESRVLTLKELRDPDTLYGRCLNIWGRTLGNYLKKRSAVWEEMLRQPVEA